MTMKDWSDGVMYVLSHFIAVPDIQGTDWQGWGMVFHNTVSLSALNPPDPYQFTDWQEWGKRLAEAFGPADGVLFNNNLTGASATANFIVSQNNINLIAQNGSFIVTQ